MSFQPPPDGSQPVLPSQPAPPAPKRGRGGNVLLVAAALVAIAGLAFAVGRFTAPTAATTFPGGGLGPIASFGPGGNGQGGNFVGRGLGGVTLQGEVTAVSADSISIQLEDGSEISVPLDDSTSYHQASSGAASDVAVGSTVTIRPGAVDTQPGASFDPGAGPINITFGPAEDVTVVED